MNNKNQSKRGFLKRSSVAPAEIVHRSITMSHFGNVAMKLNQDLEWDPKTKQILNKDKSNSILIRKMLEPWASIYKKLSMLKSMNKIRLLAILLLGSFLNSTLLCAQDNLPTGLIKSKSVEVMTEQYLRFKVDPVKRAEWQSFHRDRSVLDWRQGMPIGNGDFGATVHGYPDNLTFHIGKNDLWLFNKESDEGYPKIPFATLRERLENGEAKDVIKEISQERKMDPPLPNETTAGKFRLKLQESSTFHRVKEKLDLSTGISSIAYNAGKIESFVSREDEVLVIHASGGSSTSLLGKLKFEFYRGAIERYEGIWHGSGNTVVDITGEKYDSIFAVKPKMSDGLIWFDMELGGGNEFGPDKYVMMMGCDAPNMQASIFGSDTYGGFRPAPGPVNFYITLVSNNDVQGKWSDERIKGEDIVSVAKKRIRKALQKGYPEVRKTHADWWANYWQRGFVTLPDKQDEHPWYWSMYKAASAQRPGKVLPGYGGPWRNNNFVNWGHYCFNYEELKHLMGVLPNNRSELVEPAAALAYNTKEVMRRQTQDYFKMKGLHYPHSMSYRGTLTPYRITPINIGTSGEAVKYAWDYYDFTGDKEFLKRVTYPLLKGVANFYLDYLQKDKNGNYYISPSYWTEMLHFLNTSITDLSMFHMVFENAIKAAKILRVDVSLLKKWQEAKDNLRPFKTDKDGVWLASWDNESYDYSKAMDSNSQTYPIAMADMVDAWHGPEELRKQAKASYDYFLGDDPEAWDKSTSYITAARMGDREYMKKIYKLQYELLEGGYLWDGGEFEKLLWGSWFSVDPTSSFPSGIITESLLQSQGGDIRVFPANPLEGHYAFHSLRARGAFLVSSEMRDRKIPYVLIQSLVGNDCKLVQCFGASANVQIRDLSSGKIVLKKNVSEDEILDFKTKTGHIYVLERREHPLESISIKEITY